jgi:hypothetical protein
LATVGARRSWGSSRDERWYAEVMGVQPVLTAEQLIERVRNAPPPTDDDVTILWDGRRIDSREKALEWLAEIEVARAEEAAAAIDAQT